MQHTPERTEHFPILEDDANCPCDGGWFYDEETGRDYRCQCACHGRWCQCGTYRDDEHEGPTWYGGAWHHFDGTPCRGGYEYTS